MIEISPRFWKHASPRCRNRAIEINIYNKDLRNWMYGAIFIGFIVTLPLFYSSCRSPNPPTVENQNSVTIHDVESFYSWLHASQMEPSYDGPDSGTWGEKRNGYRVVLRDCYWKAEAYGRLGRTSCPNSQIYATRAVEAINHLKKVQERSGNGCWGIPDEPTMPEFGDRIRQIEALQAADLSKNYIVGGWIVNLPDANLPELYYDHGRSLTAFCRHYLRTNDASALTCIQKGADWCLDKPGSSNVNYDSSIIEGLSFAYSVTGTQKYWDRAQYLTENFVLPLRNPNGSYGDAHNQMLRYHGFILSGLLAFRRIVPCGDSLSITLDDHIASSRRYLAEGLADGKPIFDEESIPINIRVYAEIEDMHMEGKALDLNETEKKRLSFLYRKCMNAPTTIHSLTSDYARQKAQWHYCQTGMAVARFKYAQ